MRRIIHILLLFSLNTAVFGQPDVNIAASKNTIRTGEPDTIQLSASWPGHSLTQGFSIPDSFPHFEVWDKGALVPNTNGYTQNIVVAGYDSGRFSLPPFELKEAAGVKTDSLAINIEPVNVDSLKEYHDIKDIIEVPPIPQWPYLLFIAGITLISIIALYFLLRYIKLGTAKESLKQLPVAGSYQRAIEALQKLEQQAKQPGAAKPFYTQLTGIYRNYLFETYHWRSLQQTGGELIIQAKPLLTETDFYQLANAIRLSDAVKFAKYEPPQNDWLTSLTSIRQAIEALEKKL